MATCGSLADCGVGLVAEISPVGLLVAGVPVHRMFMSTGLRVSRASCLPAFVSPCYLVPDCGSKVDAIRGTHGLLGGECGGRDLVVWLVC